VLWLLLIILLVAVFGLGTLLEAALVTMLIAAAVVLVVVLGLGRLVER
jgi:hypothetical protein